MAKNATRKTKSTDRPENSGDADSLFKKEMEGVKPLQHKQAIIKRTRSIPSRTLRAGQIEETAGTSDVLRFLRPGQQERALKNLRRMVISSGSTLDLHGYTSAEASTQLQRFIQRAKARGLAAVRIIHGKGHGSESTPVLKAMVDRRLREFPDVLAFCSAQPKNGGTGAVDVLLRK